MNPEDLLGTTPTMLVGAHAVFAYAPSRVTNDIDYFVTHDQFSHATRSLKEKGWAKEIDLGFPNTTIGLYGEGWGKNGVQIDLLSSEQEWANEAFRTPAYDPQSGYRVMPLPYLVLMKLDAQRLKDETDLALMLGNVKKADLDKITDVLLRHSHDPEAVAEVQQYALLGAFELSMPLENELGNEQTKETLQQDISYSRTLDETPIPEIVVIYKTLLQKTPDGIKEFYVEPGFDRLLKSKDPTATNTFCQILSAAQTFGKVIVTSDDLPKTTAELCARTLTDTLDEPAVAQPLSEIHQSARLVDPSLKVKRGTRMPPRS